MSWNAYLVGARTKYRPNDTIPTTTSLTINAVKGQFACWQIPLKIDGEDVSTINATCTIPTKGEDTLTTPLIYKEYLHNIIIPSRANNLGGLGTNLGNPIGEIPDALIPKVDAYYSETRNAFPFNMTRISPVYAFPVILISGGASSSVKANNTATTLPTIGGTYSGSGLTNYHIIIDGAGAKGIATFKWSTSSFNIKRAQWNYSTQVATITTYQPHGFSIGNTVRVKTSRNTFNGNFTIATVPSPTTFTYPIAGVYSDNIYYDGGGTAIKTFNASTVTTGDAIALNNGLTITFPVQTYAVGDEWEFYVNTSRVETLWMESYIPTDAVEGIYTSTITITAGGKGDITLNLTIVVYNFAIGKEPTVPIWYTGQNDHPIRGHFNTLWFDPNSSIHKELIKRYVESALRHRMTMRLTPNIVYAANNLSINDWETLHKPWLTLYLNGTWTQGVEPTGLKWTAYFNRNPTILVQWGSVIATDYTSAEKTRLSTLAGLLDAEGWMATYKPYIFVAEEPSVYIGNAQTAVENAYISMNLANSNYRAVVTKRVISNWVGSVDVWNSNILQFGSYPRSTYDAEIAAGRELWVYQGCDTQGCGEVGTSGYDRNVTYNIDSTMSDIIGYWWLSYDNDVRGDLYYNTIEAESHYNYYPGKAQQDFWDIQLNYGGNGEGTFWYPGRVSSGGHAIGGTTDVPIESLRLKAWRMGQEDYEIFKLTNRSALSLTNVENAVGTDKWRFTSGATAVTEANMEMARDNILNSLTGVSPSPSMSPSISPSASMSPSVSPSVSLSMSPSESPSVSPSVSPSASPSLSPSSSESPSASPSLSPSPFPPSPPTNLHIE